MPGAIRSFTGHFIPHVVLALSLCIIVLLIPTFFLVGVTPGLALPTWPATFITVAVVITGWCTYAMLRYYHDRHRCTRCDRNGYRFRYEPARLGFLALHFHWCRTSPGIWIYLVAWLVVTAVSAVSTVGTVLTYAGIALWLASTIAHQARLRSCPAHTAAIMYDPPARWFTADRMLAQLHYRARGCDHLHLKCQRYACEDAAMVTSVEEAMVWTLEHSDAHTHRMSRSPMVILEVTIDPDLEMLEAETANV